MLLLFIIFLFFILGKCNNFTLWIALKFDMLPFHGNVNGKFANWWLYILKFDYVEFDKDLYNNWIDYFKNGFGFTIRVLTIIQIGVGNSL